MISFWLVIWYLNGFEVDKYENKTLQLAGREGGKEYEVDKNNSKAGSQQES